ncbi:4700_t:CDS:2, partial [Scutellospora calospora]
CYQSYSHICDECNTIFEFFAELKDNSENDVHEELAELQDQLCYYMAHQTCKVYLNRQFNANLLDLNENKALIFVDYKMKILPKSARETNSSTKLKVQAFDHWSADMQQDSWFTASSLHAVMEVLKNKYGIQVEKWVFLKAGEAKTMIDSHYAQISHAINRYVRLGFDISEEQNIENAIQNIHSTSVTNLKPNQNRRKFAGCILACAIPNIRNWKIFSPADLEKLCKKDIHKPNSEIFTHTTHYFNSTRLNKRNLIKELSLRGIEVNKKENRSCDINSSVLVEKNNMSNDRMGIKREAKIWKKESWKKNCKKNMYKALQQRVLESKIKAEAIPKVSTIQN